MKPIARKLTFILAVLTLLVTVASGQYRAAVQGVVMDPTGAMVPDATVTVINTETNSSRTAATSVEGVFSVTGLSPGRYKITVDKEGFAQALVEQVEVGAEQTQQ